MKYLISTILFFIAFAGMDAQFDIIIKNGKIVDGTGNPWYIDDVGITDGKIAFIGKILDGNSKMKIDAKGKIVCPGFIDVHGHIERSITIRGEAKNFILDGVTTVVTGNCGGSMVRLTSYFDTIIANGTSINVATLIGHNSVRRLVMGTGDRAPSEEELSNMKKTVALAMEQGALGLSTGLIYVPGTYSETEEVVELAKSAGEYGGLYVSHIRTEDEGVFGAIQEAVEIGKRAKIPVEISHFKITGKKSWGESHKMIQMIDDFRSENIDVTVDQYPYSASSTSINVLLPTWSLSDGREEIMKKLKNPETRKKIKSEMKTSLRKTGFKDYSYCFVASCESHPEYIGKNISEINKELGNPTNYKGEIETILQIFENGGASMIYHKMDEQDVETIMQYPKTMIASDGGIQNFGIGSPHPRSYGTNARVLGKYVRELKILKLEDAIRKMTSLPAQKFNLNNRGLLTPGMAADIVIFDEWEITDKATFPNPHQYSQGIEYVIVNGIIVAKQGVHAGSKPGKILYGPGKKKQM